MLIPDGAYGSDNKRGWNDCRANTSTNPETDDVKFLNSLVDTITQKYSLNEHRVYVHGTSNGGKMAYRLAVESGVKYRAIASIVASMPEPNKNECRNSKSPIPVLIMNGTNDPLVPYNGGAIGNKRTQKKYDRGTVASTRDTVKYWLNNNDIRARPKVTMLANINRRDRSKIRVEQYSPGRNNSEVVLYQVIGGGHTEPSLSEHYARIYKLIVGQQNRDVEMAEEVWKFFERHR